MKDWLELAMRVGESHNAGDGDNRREESCQSFRSQFVKYWRESYLASDLAASYFRFVWWWLTSRDPNKPSGRAWAKQLGISHTWLQKLVREFTADPSKVRRLRAYGDPTTAQLSRAREYTQQMRERGELRVSRRAKWEKFFERYPEARGIYHSSGKFVNRLRGRRSA